jgi:hypothetical protein
VRPPLVLGLVLIAACGRRPLSGRDGGAAGATVSEDGGGSGGTSVAGTSGVAGAGATGAGGGFGGVGGSTPISTSDGAMGGAPADARFDAPSEPTGPAPGPFMLTAPIDKPDEQAAPLLFWTPSEGAVTYEVEVSTTEAFTSASTQRLADVTKPQSFIPKAIPGATVHYWRVTAIGPGGARTLASNAPAWFATPLEVSANAYGVAVTASGKVVLANRDTPGGATIVDLATGQARSVGTAGVEARQVSLSPDGRQAFVSEIGQYHVAVIDVEGNAEATFLPGTPGLLIYGHAVTPDGSTLVAPFMDQHTTMDVLGLFPLQGTATPRLIPLGHQQIPYTVVLTPDGKSALVDIDGLTRVDLVSGAQQNLQVFGAAIAITADGRSAWMTDSGMPSKVQQIDLPTFTAGKVIDFRTGNDLCGIAITPDGKRGVVTSFLSTAVLNLEAGTVETVFSVPSRCATISADGHRAFVTVTANSPGKLIAIPL